MAEARVSGFRHFVSPRRQIHHRKLNRFQSPAFKAPLQRLNSLRIEHRDRRESNCQPVPIVFPETVIQLQVDRRVS